MPTISFFSLIQAFVLALIAGCDSLRSATAIRLRVAVRDNEDPPPVTAAEFSNAKPPEEISMPPEESVPDRRDLPPLPLPPLVNSKKSYPVPTKRLFVENNRESPPLPSIPQGEDSLVGDGPSNIEDKSVNPGPIFRLSHLAGEDDGSSSEAENTEEEFRVGGQIPPRVRAFKHATKTWERLKALLRRAAKLEEKQEEAAISESQKRLEAAMQVRNNDDAAEEEEKKLGKEGDVETESGESTGAEVESAEADSTQGVHIPTRGEVAAMAANRLQNAVDWRVSTDLPH